MPPPIDHTPPIPEPDDESVDKEIDESTDDVTGLETNSEVLARLRLIGKLIIPPAAN